MKRRVLSMLLCVAMALSLLPMSALAAESKNTPAWAQAYRKCIQDDFNKLVQEYGKDDWYYKLYEYCLINIDDDNIPELCINRPIAAAENEIYTFTNGKIYSQMIDGHSFLSYLPEEGLFLESGGHDGVWWDNVYQLKNGEFTQVASGSGYLEDWYNPQYDEDGNLIYQYLWNKNPVDTVTYQQKLNNVFPASKAYKLDDGDSNWKSYQEMLDFLDQQESVESGKRVQYQGHYYAIYNLEDIVPEEKNTWENARDYCIKKGGHLATITSKGENDFLFNYMRDEGVESAYFGFSDTESEGNWRWCTGEKSSYTNWNEHEPNQENPDEDYAMFYYKYSDGTWNDGDFGRNTVNSGTWFICEWDPENPDNNVDFDRYVYQAKSLDRTEFPAIANIRATMNQDTATDLFISGLKDSGFEVAMGISDLCKLYSDSIDNIMALPDFAIKPKDLYEAVILNALEDDLDASIDVLDDQLETYLGWGKDLTSLVESTLKTDYGIDYMSGRDSLASLSKEEKQKIIEKMEEEFTKKYPVISGAGDLSTGLGIVLDSVDNIEDCWNRFSSCVFARRASESVKEVVHQAYKESLKTNNFYLQSALADCVEIIDSSAAEFALRALSDTCMVAGKRSMNYLVKEIFWEDVKNSIYIALPGVAIIQCGYKGGQLVSNFLFSTDNISEKYAKMKIVNSVTSVFEKASSSLKANFLNQQSSHTAQTYLSSVDFLFRLWAQDCDEAYNFVDTLDRAMISNVAKLFGSTYYNDTKDAINMKKNTYATQRSMAEVAWIYLLDEDYPNSGLSDQYQWIIDQHNESLRKKIKVACPVNVYVYDSNGKLVAYAENGRVSSTGPVTIALNDDVKTIYFYDDAKYNIQYTGTGTGDMDITVSEFDATETTARTVNFFDVPLKKSTQYSMNVEAGVLQKTGYTVNGKQGTVSHDFDSLAKNAHSSYTATIKSGAIMQDSGVVTSATALAGEELEILAYVPDGYAFVKWQSDAGDDIFADAQSTNTTVRMPTSDVSISAVLKSTSSSVSGLPFKDVKTADWFYNDVKYVYEKGMMAGTAADVFAPNATTTRAMIVTILYRLEGSPAVTGTSAFVDVPAGQWYTDAVNWAAANQIVKGTSATTFAPNDSITREQMAAILYRYAQYKGYDVTKKADLSGYSDNGQVSAYAKDALAWANAAKLINGVTNTTLAPQGNATRAQVSAILHRFCDGVAK